MATTSISEPLAIYGGHGRALRVVWAAEELGVDYTQHNLNSRDGSTQTAEFLAEARVREGDAFDLKRFHDFLWLNGNVPIALQKEEYLAATGAD